MKRIVRIASILVLFTTVACGSSSTSPSAPTPTPAPTPSTVSLTGIVTLTGTSVRLSGVTIRILDGPNVGRTTITGSSGIYRFDDLMIGNANLSASASGWVESLVGVYIDGTNTLNFTIRSIAPWTQSGAGNTTFEMPTYITRVRIRGIWSGTGPSTFIVNIGGRQVVNAIVSEWPNQTYDSIHATTGGAVEISNSLNILSWAFTEVAPDVRPVAQPGVDAVPLAQVK